MNESLAAFLTLKRLGPFRPTGREQVEKCRQLERLGFMARGSGGAWYVTDAGLDYSPDRSGFVRVT